MTTRVLFDSHTLIWYITGDRRLPARVREIADDNEVDVFGSYTIERTLPCSVAQSGFDLREIGDANFAKHTVIWTTA